MLKNDGMTGGLFRQRGVSLLGWLLLVVLVGVWVYAAFQLVPAYIENAELGSVLSAVKTEARTASLQSIQRDIADQLTINSINDVTTNEFKFAVHGDELTISINHPIQKSFIDNLFFVLQSRHSITVTRSAGAD